MPDLGADEWAALLTGCATPAQVLDALAGADGSSLAALLQGRPGLAAILAQAEPAAVGPWWAELDEAQKDALIHAAPAIIGNLGGVSYAARDEANRIWLDAQLDEARAALAEAEKPPTFHEMLGGRGAAVAHAEQLEQARTRVAGLEAVQASLVTPDGGAPRSLITLTADSPPLAAISIGDLDAADNVTFAVPGMGTTTEGIEDWTRASQNLADLQNRLAPEQEHAVVAWVGYETPPIPVAEGGFGVMGNAFAERGAANLGRDLAVVDAMRPGALVNVVAHSYGTTTSSIALTRDDVHVDAYVTLGSAGLPADIDSASDLHADHVFAGQAQDVWAIDPAGGDQWAWTGRLSPEHPVNPISPDFGAHGFSVVGGDGPEPVTDHGVLTPSGTGYLDIRTESLRNVALATSGYSDAVSPYAAPGPTPLQQAFIEGLAHGTGY
ncbi:alpha/beta hydrolase [Microbacterium trichothecenolyticum]|uniref:alpha/beta hydrolase n=1 Tax=Microbacterium trichothecenolyticum TaxID=69370 RepID=UPI0027D90E1A|nr:alpha/beta hydrolase [Microbacterium trichothecenolyticum]